MNLTTRITLREAVQHARIRAHTSHSAAARTLIAAGVPFKQACHFALHCARSHRVVRGPWLKLIKG